LHPHHDTGDQAARRVAWSWSNARTSRLWLALLVAGCVPYSQAPADLIYVPEHPFVDRHEESVQRLLAQERALRQEQQGEKVKQLGFDLATTY
jgi:hypothetical protein